MIVDTHVHIWKYPDHFNKPVLLRNEPERRAHWPEERWKKNWDSPVENYIKETEGIVDKAILLPLKMWSTYGFETPNDYIASEAKKYPGKLYWCCCVDPTDPGAIEEVERCAKMGAIGIGEITPGYTGFNIRDPRCYKVWAKAEELDLPLVIHASPSHPHLLRIENCGVAQIDNIAIDFPKLKIVLCHMGQPYEYELGAFLTVKHKNVYVDISHFIMGANLDRRIASRYLPVAKGLMPAYYHMFGPILYAWTYTFGQNQLGRGGRSNTKLLMGSDWKTGSPVQTIEALKNMNGYLKDIGIPAEVSDEDIHNVLHENWKEVFTKIKY